MSLTTNVSIEDYFRNGLLPNKRTDFPYPARFCRFCERELQLIDAIHLQDEMESYKALYICLHDDCGAYDEDAGQAYARVYYSSQRAFENLEQARINVLDLPKKR